MTHGAAQQLAAECTGSALLLATVVGSGIMGERLCGGNMAIALLANTLATGAVLYALITAFAPISGAHFNPAVTLAEAWSGKLPWRRAGLYIAVQFGGALIGVVIAHWMFDLGAFSASRHVRAGTAQALSEVVATFGLLTIILNCARHRPQATAAAVGTYIAAAYWFTASTSFANPAVTAARTLTDTFSGIRPVDAPVFMLAQVAGAVLAVVLHRWMTATRPA
jgi:glycerol uptake facilitator-like aquaporin